MSLNSSSAFPEHILEKLKCTRREHTPNWRYIDRPMLRRAHPNIPTHHQISKCYSQEDQRKGITLIEFFEGQGRVFKKGDWIFEEAKKN